MEDLLFSALRLAIPIAFLAVGEMVAERAGVLNLGIEGLLLSTALAAAIGAQSGGIPLGIAAAIGVGLLYNLIVALLTVVVRADQIVVGLALNIGALGATAFVFRASFESGQDFARISPFRIPGLDDVPYLRLLTRQTWLVLLLVLVVAFLAWALRNTNWGLRLRSVGDAPAAVDSQGVNVMLVRTGAVVFAGAMGGLAGAYLVLVETGRFVEGLSGGRGFLAIAAVVFGGWRPIPVLIGALLFGFGQALQFQLPAMGYDIPTPLLLALPYVLALVVITLAPTRRAAPPALMRPFYRGAT